MEIFNSLVDWSHRPFITGCMPVLYIILSDVFCCCLVRYSEPFVFLINGSINMEDGTVIALSGKGSHFFYAFC